MEDENSTKDEEDESEDDSESDELSQEIEDIIDEMNDDSDSENDNIFKIVMKFDLDFASTDLKNLEGEVEETLAKDGIDKDDIVNQKFTEGSVIDEISVKKPK